MKTFGAGITPVWYIGATYTASDTKIGELAVSGGRSMEILTVKEWWELEKRIKELMKLDRLCIPAMVY